jgi:hypothetical protein
MPGAIEMNRRRILAWTVLFAAAGCASQSGAVVVAQETRSETALDVTCDGETLRRVRVVVEGEATVLTLDDARIVCEGHAGYFGRIGTTRGVIFVGALAVSYDDRRVRAVGPSGIYEGDVFGGRVITVSQSGAARTTP